MSAGGEWRCSFSFGIHFACSWLSCCCQVSFWHKPPIEFWVKKVHFWPWCFTDTILELMSIASSCEPCTQKGPNSMKKLQKNSNTMAKCTLIWFLGLWCLKKLRKFLVSNCWCDKNCFPFFPRSFEIHFNLTQLKTRTKLGPWPREHPSACYLNSDENVSKN